MNANQRKNITKAIELLETAKGMIEEEQGEEESKFDNLNEGLQNSEKGEKLQASSEALSSAMSSIEEAIDYCNTATE